MLHFVSANVDLTRAHEILKIVQFSQSTYYCTIRRQRLTGNVIKAKPVGIGRPRSLIQADADYLLHLARHTPTLFLDEYCDRLDKYRFLPISLATIHRTFIRAHLSVKRVQKMALERDPILRANFIRCISQYPAHYLLAMDEVSKDDRTYARLWGRSSVGTRVEEHQPFVRKLRLSMVVCLALDEGIIVARVLEGSFTHQTFYEYLRDYVVCVY